ncbi:MAG: Magnesium and cobalt efflux protein CorC [Smithella sp. PtaU1.Bin162]|nr:MAG: Magnesium and cobalt efflux protein CorC [Smithella sp. PtaU1.Bin162]
MNSIGIEILLIFFLIILNGLLALSELALVSARKTRLEQLANKGDIKAQIALRLVNSPDSFLSTIQIGITFISILAGAFGGATIAELMARYFATFPELVPYSETISVAIVVVCITYFSLIIGELIPKKLALNNPENLACLVAPTIYRLSKLAYPLVILLSGSTNSLLHIFRFKASAAPTVTEEEIKILIDKGTQAGTFQEFEQDTIDRVFRLADRRVSILMTPRADIVWLDLNESEEETKRKIAQHRYSAYPVARDTLDDVVGVIRGKELLSLAMEGKPFDLKKTFRTPLFVLETTPAVKVMELFKKSKTHIGFVVDEYGMIQGLVTFGDILRSVFEDVEDTVEGEREIVKRQDGSLLVSGSLPLDEFVDYMEIAKLSDEEHLGINTVGGFVMTKLGSVPSEGQHFEWRGLKFEVVDMDSRRVDKILVLRIKDNKETKEL